MVVVFVIFVAESWTRLLVFPFAIFIVIAVIEALVYAEFSYLHHMKYLHVYIQMYLDVRV